MTRGFHRTAPALSTRRGSPRATQLATAFVAVCVLLGAGASAANAQGAGTDSQQAPASATSVGAGEANLTGEATDAEPAPATTSSEAPASSTPAAAPGDGDAPDAATGAEDTLFVDVETLDLLIQATEELEAELAPEGPLVDRHAPARLAFGMNFRGYAHVVPSAVLRAFFDQYVSHWSDGPRYVFGGEMLLRMNRSNDIILGVDVADFSTTNGWWLDNGEPPTSADWGENNMRLVTVAIEWNGITTLTNDGRMQFYYGAGLGAAVRLGEFRKYPINTECLPAGSTVEILGSLQRGMPCGDGTSDAVQGDSPEEQRALSTLENIPAVLPALNITMGFRYLIADVVSIGIEGGFKTAALYGGLEVGFLVGQHRRRPSSPSTATSAGTSTATSAP